MKRVLITGSSKGIGKAIAVRLAQEKYQVIVHTRSDLEQAQKVVAEIAEFGGSAQILQFDISNREETKNILLADIEENGMYWGIVCNAGIAQDTPFPLMNGDVWDAVLRTNLDGFFNVLQPLTMPLVETRRGGRIVTLSSVSGIMGNRGQVN
jgi:3-oxoacyl-[acyl-carrier protein] reductase